MAAGQQPRSLISRRRRGGDDEDEESVNGDVDTQSEISVITGAEDDAADASNASDPGISTSKHDATTSELDSNGAHVTAPAPKPTSKSVDSSPKKHMTTESTAKPVFTSTPDTHVMLNGMTAAAAPSQDQAIPFEDLTNQNDSKSPARTETLADRRKREQNEYRNKRDADPTFIPSRGNFFMHDPRGPDQRGFGVMGRGRGRGRGFVGGPFAPAP